MRIISSIFIFVFVASCTTKTNFFRQPESLQLNMCKEYMGDHWKRITPPSEAAMMFDLVHFEVTPSGVIWYKNDQDIIGACAYTRDKNGCGYSGHEFKRAGDLLFHTTIWSQERICVVG